MRVLVLAVSILLYSISAYAQFDNSEYRQTTYGAPDHYCDPTRSLASSGTGTLGDPWNLTQCQSEPVCGEVIGLLPVGSGTPVQIPVPTGGVPNNEPSFNPTGITDCTLGNELVYVAKYAAISLDRATITTNQNRTEFRTNGTAEAADVVGTGHAAYGTYDHDYVIFDGIFTDMAYVGINGDQGVISTVNATGVQFLNFRIKGTTTDMDSNPVIYRPGNSVDTTLSNFEVWDFDNSPTGTGLNQNGLFSDQYGDRNYTIEKFVLDNTDRGIFPKGTQGGNFNYGTIRYGIIKNVQTCMLFNDFDSVNVTEVHHVLCYGWQNYGINLSGQTSAPRNFLLHHVTISGGTPACTSTNDAGPFYIQQGTPSNVTIRDNIFDYPNTAYCRGMWLNEISTMPTANYNGYYRGAGSPSWSFNGGTSTTIANWRSATSQEADSTVLASDPFYDRGNSDYSLAVGHAANTASTTGGELGAYEGNHVIGYDVSTSGSVGQSGNGTGRLTNIKRF